MAALVCDLCGGKLTMGAGGIAVCDSCGMKHSADRMKEKVQEIKGVVRVDNTHMIETYIEMANSAYNANNHAEAEAYCNKIIEIVPTDYRAWFLKGKAAGWQSTLQNSRISETVLAFEKAIGNVPEEEKEDLLNQMKEQLIDLSTAMVSLRKQRFEKWPDEEETLGFYSDVHSIVDTVTLFNNHVGVISFAEITKLIAAIIYLAAVEAYRNIVAREYNGNAGDPDDRPDKYRFQQFIQRTGYCIRLIETSITMHDENDAANIERYRSLITIEENACKSCSWDYIDVGLGKSWYVENQLTNEAKNLRTQKIREYNEKIRKIEAFQRKKEREEAQKRREEAQRRREAYWKEHADEKNRFELRIREIDAEIAQLQRQTREYDTQIDEIQKELQQRIPEEAQLGELKRREFDLINQKSKLGIFSGKQKKALQEQIESMQPQIRNMQESIQRQKKTFRMMWRQG